MNGAELERGGTAAFIRSSRGFMPGRQGSRRLVGAMRRRVPAQVDAQLDVQSSRDAGLQSPAYSPCRLRGLPCASMEILDVLDRLPAIADALQRSRQAEPPPRELRPDPAAMPWRLVAREAGHPGAGTVHMRSYTEARAMALELSDIGFTVTVHDDEDRVRLRMWPPHP
jgi:hypothetical protein